MTIENDSLDLINAHVEWDMDRYAREILGWTDEEIDETGSQDCIHTWVTRDLLKRQREVLERDHA